MRAAWLALTSMSLLLAGCIEHPTVPNRDAAPLGDTIVMEASGPSVVHKTSRVGLGIAESDPSGSNAIGFPVTGIDGQQPNCLAFDTHGSTPRGITVNASWTANTDAELSLRLVVGGQGKEAEASGPSPLRLELGADQIRESQAGPLSRLISVQLPSTSTPPKVSIDQAIDLEVTLHMPDDEGVNFSPASCTFG